VAVAGIVFGLVVAITAILSFAVNWPFAANKAVLTWLGHRPISIAVYPPTNSPRMPPDKPIPDWVADAQACARMVKLHCYNHADQGCVVDFANSKVRRSIFRGMRGAAVVPWDSVRFGARIPEGEHIALTLWMVNGEPWPEDVKRVRLIVKGRTRAHEKVRWRGTVRIRPYGWSPPFLVAYV
jgi:hypothetical protein